MPTINAMVRNTSLMYNVASKGLNIGTTSSQSFISSMLGTTGSTQRQTGINYASGANYISSVLGSRTTLNNMVTDYNSGRTTFKSEFSSAMNTAKKASSSLKNLSANTASTATSKTVTQAKSAASSLGSFVNKSNLSSSLKTSLNNGLSAFQRYADRGGTTDLATTRQAKNAVTTLKSVIGQQTGIDADTAKSTKEATEKASNYIDQYNDQHENTAKTIREGVNTIQSYLDRFENTGRFDADVSRLGNVLGTIQNAVSDSQGLRDAASDINAFADQYATDEETQSQLSTSASTIRDFADRFQSIDDDMAAEVEASITAVNNFLLEGQNATADTVDAARTAISTLQNFSSTYAAVGNLGQDEWKSLQTAASNIQGIAAQAAEPFEQLEALENFDKNYASAQKSAVAEAQSMAKKIQDIIGQYNDTASYLQDNRGISTRFDNFASSFTDTQYFAKSLDSIGIAANTDGSLSVNTDALAKAIQENPNSVDRILGQDGLAGRIDQKVSMSSYQSEKMFPTIDSILGRSVASTSAMYSSRSAIASLMYSNIGNFMDMYI